MRKIAVVGAGYVGLTTAAALAELGNDVRVYERDPARAASLRRAVVPFYEPQLGELVARNYHAGRLAFCGSLREAVEDAQVVFIAVATPAGPDGAADLSQVRAAAAAIAPYLSEGALIVNKSTVPVETGDLISAILREHIKAGQNVTVVSNPEFMREGSAVNDFLHPDRIVVGADDPAAYDLMEELYAPLDAPMIKTDVRTAEMIKYAANAFLATKISFINEVAAICERLNLDVKTVAGGIGADKRIGPSFLMAGLGFGGSCLPKDVTALTKLALANGINPQLLRAVLGVNDSRIIDAVDTLERACNGLSERTIGVLGIAFKPDTDDLRESRALALVEVLLERGAQVALHDPAALSAAKALLGERVRYVEDRYEVMQNADALVVATDWNEYKRLDFAIARKLMRGDMVYDARNIYEPKTVLAAGLRYLGFARGAQAVTLPS